MATQSALQYRLTITHSCTHSHADGSSGAVRVRWHSARKEPGIELATFAVTSQPRCLLSYCRPYPMIRLGSRPLQTLPHRQTLWSPTGSEEAQQGAVDVVTVPFPLKNEVDHAEVPALDDQRAAGGGQGQLLHRGYVVMQDLEEGEREVDQRNTRSFFFCSSNVSESLVNEETNRRTSRLSLIAQSSALCNGVFYKNKGLYIAILLTPKVLLLWLIFCNSLKYFANTKISFQV